MSVFRVEVGVDGEGGASQTVTITDEPGTTIEEQAIELAKSLWPDKEYVVVVTGEFDEQGNLKTDTGRPAWAPPEVEKKAVAPPMRVKELRRELRELEKEIQRRAISCVHQWGEHLQTGPMFTRECSVCGLEQRTFETTTIILRVPDWEATPGQKG